MPQDFGIWAGLAGGFATAAAIVAVVGVGDVIWSYLPIGNDNETLSEYSARITGVGGQ